MSPPVTQLTNCVDGLTCALGNGIYGGSAGKAPAAKLAISALSSARLVVWGGADTFCALRPPSVEKKFSNSRRANASRPHINGGWAGVVGEVPASGFKTQLMTFDTTLATAVTGSGDEAAAGATGEPVTCAAIIGETLVGPAAARPRASANTATLSGCWMLLAGSANGSTVGAD